jgi:hypothetical protein
VPRICVSAAHAKDPSKNISQYFAKIFAANDGVGYELRKQDRYERGLPFALGK